MKRNDNGWFTVDREGLAKILRRKGSEFAVFELIQNCWDEKGVTRVDVELSTASKGYARLKITDDAPEGFSDLTHAYTLFKDSAKKANAEQRGRFNLGEKLVLALCRWATVTTTKGMVVFDSEGRTVKTSKGDRREYGTVFEAEIKMNKDEVERVCEEVKKLIPPRGIPTYFNGELLVEPVITTEFEASLPTELADADGALRKATRKGLVRIYKVAEGDDARIHEMGIPVVDHNCAWHVDVLQKVPLTLDRENVTPAFLRALRTVVFNATHELVTPEQTTAEWAQTAIESKDVEPAAVKDYVTKRFGQRRVSFDPSDPEANHKAVAEGYTLVHSRMLSVPAWENVRAAEAITPAGQVFPTHPDDVTPHQPAEETDDIKRTREYAKLFARETIGCDITVDFGMQPSREAADFGGTRLQFNVKNLGKSWFDGEKNLLAIDDLITHELGHYYESNHLSKEYNNALTRIAAKAIQAAREGRLLWPS